MAIQRGKKTLNAREQAAQVRKWAGWTKEQYNKEYDKLRNRVRNYERANGYEKGSINVADLLAKEVRNRHYAPRYGEQPRSTQLYMAVNATTSASTGRALTSRATKLSQTAAIAAIEGRYYGLLSKSQLVKDRVKWLKENIPDYTAKQLEQAILEAAHESNAVGEARRAAHKELLRKGVITEKPIDTL